MCGIAGFVNLDGAPADAAVVGAMLRAIRHRGPDDRGHLVLSLRRGVIAGAADAAADTAIGCQRLKILDLSDQGHQPMVSHSGTIVIALNGEIYNAFDYVAELTAAGHQFRSRTDTEVVLYLYERYGIEGLLARLNGMFAIVIADLRSGEVHLARDHFGIKPLYWVHTGSSVLFASEAKAFLAHPAYTAAIDEEQVDEQLAFRYVAGEVTLLKGVRHLRPGHRLRITPEGATIARYWSIPDPDKARLTREQATDQLDEMMRASVAAQLVSDVRVGCQLSGGIDSSLVTLFARPRLGAGMDTFSVIFEDPKFSEERWIDEASATVDAAGHQFLFSGDSFMAPLDRAAYHMDQPISHPNALGIWLLAERARERVTVLLCGEGADEVFGGYPRFHGAHQLPPEAFIQTTQFQPASKLARLRPGADLGPALARRLAIFHEGAGDHLSKCLKYEMQTFLVDVLARQDRMTMAHGVETRVPFLDRRVVELARTLPPEHLVADDLSAGAARSTKIVVKALARRSFDEAFVYRWKSGFNLPLSQYFRSAPFTELMEDRLLPGMKQRGLVSDAAVRELWRRSLSAPALTEPFWGPVALELWAQEFVDQQSALRDQESRF